MPKRVPVQSLLSAAMSAAATLIVNSITAASARTKEFSCDDSIICDIQKHLSTIPACVKEQLLQSILRSEELDSIVRYGALKTILFPPMKTLSPGIFPHTYYAKVAQIIRVQGTALETLDLRGVWLKGDLSCELMSILHSLKNLRELHIPHMATDALFEIIGQCNKSLQVLDIMGECNITECGVELLCNVDQTSIRNNLLYVLLGNPGGNEVSPRVVSLLLKYLPNLQSLGSYPHVGQAMEFMLNDDPFAVTNLVHLHDSQTDLNRINLIIGAAPMLESIFVDHPCDGVIAQLSCFDCLTKVKLQRFQVNDFYTFIEKIGTRLLVLELLSGVGTLDLGSLSKWCPNLVKLVCYKMGSIRHFDNVYFPNVKNIGVYYSDISTSSVKNLMMASMNIEKLSLGDFLEITDDDIIEIFTTRQFPKLQHIWFPNAVYLTTISIQILMECCPNLMSIGEISGWNMTEVEANVIIGAIEAENFSLKIIEYFRR